METNYLEMIVSTKDLLIDFYNYSEEQAIVDYTVVLKDGGTFKADLVLTNVSSIPYAIVFVTSGAIPADQVKAILTQSSLQFGVVRQMKEDGYSEFWGIEKKTNIITGKIEFENIPDYPKPIKCSNIITGAVLSFLETWG